MKNLMRIISLVFLAVLPAWGHQWVLPIKVSDGINSDTLRYGIHPSCSNGYDHGHDIYAPPAPPTGAFDCRLRYPTPPAASEDYKIDIRSDLQQNDTFYVYYSSGASGGPVILSWDATAFGILAQDFIITDNLTGSLFNLDMRTASTLNVSSSPFLQTSLRIVIYPPYTPVQLASFTATHVNIHSVRLDWRTITEINNFGFEVQRRREDHAYFLTLAGGFVAGHGTTSIPHDYYFIDSTLSPGIWWYRLKQIDLDGSSHYFDPIRVDLVTVIDVPSIPRVFALPQNHPNPFNPATTISFSIPRGCAVSLKVFDMLGREVATLVNAERQAGTYIELFDAAGLASGMYFYRLEAGNFAQTRKMVITK